MLVAGAMMGFGGWLPWVYTEAGRVVIGAVGGGLWVFYAGLIVLAGGMLPPRLRTWGLGLQLATAVVVQHLFYTTW